MFHSSSFHFRKNKNMSCDYRDRKMSRHRFRDATHMKLMDILNSLRHRKLRRNVSHRSSSHSRGFPPPFADHHLSPLLSDLSPLHAISRYRSDARSSLSVTEEDCSSGMSTSSRGRILFDMDRGHHSSPPPAPTFPTSPSMFQLRSTSTKDYLVERLEQHLSRLRLGDVVSPDHDDHDASPPIPHDAPMDVSPQRPIDPEPAPKHLAARPFSFSESNTQKSTSSLPHDPTAVPMILITSVGAKHGKPSTLPPSDQRQRPSSVSRTPLGPSTLVNQPAGATHASTSAEAQRKSKLRLPLDDDPFVALVTSPQSGPGDPRSGHHHPPANEKDHIFRLASLPGLGSARPYAPETPTPMYCDHAGDCRGELWEAMHPPLGVGRFVLPPFTLPSLCTGLFDDVS